MKTKRAEPTDARIAVRLGRVHAVHSHHHLQERPMMAPAAASFLHAFHVF